LFVFEFVRRIYITSTENKRKKKVRVYMFNIHIEAFV